MTAYQPQPGMHPGMAPHGHPGMTPGQPMNPAQMQQMGHPGASGPGAPHMTQPGAMMGMQPGGNGMGGPGGMGGQHPGGQMGGMPGQMGGQSMAGGAPNAQALSHMNPQAMMQQQHMQQQSKSFPFYLAGGSVDMDGRAARLVARARARWISSGLCDESGGLDEERFLRVPSTYGIPSETAVYAIDVIHRPCTGEAARPG